MSIIKSFSVGSGDMFYIKHNVDSFSVIDCCMNEEDRRGIVEELKYQSKDKTIKRFISTHSDDDHIRGLEYLNQPPRPEKVALMTFIRHSTHHPENPHNDEYSPEKLESSIGAMMDLIKNDSENEDGLPDKEGNRDVD